MLKLAMALFALLLTPFAMAQTVTVSDLGAQVPAGNVSQGQTDYIALGFGMARGFGNPPTNFTGCTVANVATTPAGPSDTVRVRLVHDLNTNGAVDGGDTIVATSTTNPGFPLNFSGFSESIPDVTQTSNIFPYLVAVDVDGAATAGNVYRLDLTSVTVSAGSTTGTPINGNDHTIIAPSNAEIDIDRGGTAIASGASDTVGNRQTSVQFSLTYTIANNGTGTLNLTGSPRVEIPGVSIQNCTATVNPQPPASVSAMSSTTFTVDVTPGTSGQPFGFGMVIVNNDSDESQYTIAVSGDSVATGGGAVALVITTQPAGANAGAAFTTQPVVEARDASNAVVTSFTGNVVASILTNPASGTLSGTATIAAVNGVAAFTNLSIDNAGVGYELRFSSSPLTPADSNTFDVTGVAGAATQLVIVTQPGNGSPGTNLPQQPEVQVQDAGGLLVTTDNSTQVTVSIATGTAGAVLSGTTTVTAVGGVVTFTDLSIDLDGNYTLSFDDGGALTDATSNSFSLIAGSTGGGGGGGGSDSGGGCAVSTEASLGLLLTLALVGVVLRRRQRA